MTTEKPRSSKQATTLRRQIAGIIEGRKTFSMDLCWAVHETFEKMVLVAGEPMFIWEAWGFNGWKEFVGKELGLYPTTAYAYRHIWEVFGVELDGCWDKKLTLGITKMRILAADQGLSKRNVNSKLKKAAGKTCAKLRSEVFNISAMRSFSVGVNDQDMSTLKKAVEEARSALGEEADGLTRGEVLTYIVAEWRNINRVSKSVKAAKRGRKKRGAATHATLH